MSLIDDPIEVSKDILPREMLEAQLFNSDALLCMHVVDKLDEGVPVRGQGVGTYIPFMGQVLRQEPAKLFGKVCRCRHRPYRVSGKQKRLSLSTVSPFRDTSRRSDGHTAQSKIESGVPNRQTI